MTAAVQLMVVKLHRTLALAASVRFRDSVGDSNRTGLYDFRSGVGLEPGVHTGGGGDDGGDGGCCLSDCDSGLCFSSGDQTPVAQTRSSSAVRCGFRASADAEISSRTSQTMHITPLLPPGAGGARGWSREGHTRCLRDAGEGRTRRFAERVTHVDAATLKTPLASHKSVKNERTSVFFFFTTRVFFARQVRSNFRSRGTLVPPATVESFDSHNVLSYQKQKISPKPK